MDQRYRRGFRGPAVCLSQCGCTLALFAAAPQLLLPFSGSFRFRPCRPTLGGAAELSPPAHRQQALSDRPSPATNSEDDRHHDDSHARYSFRSFSTRLSRGSHRGTVDPPPHQQKVASSAHLYSISPYRLLRSHLTSYTSSTYPRTYRRSSHAVIVPIGSITHRPLHLGFLTLSFSQSSPHISLLPLGPPFSM